ncbi:hypothetical protein R1flu_019534 [Riccia fluitans]|uniref:non-specific serine/threonine protein kinase n=1 Tax=Riccia fluitans TaxID=41844 RepID=A0ABD1ZIX8_9MARC
MAFVFLVGLCILLIQVNFSADAQEGFISIDCGEVGSPYTDARGITWVPDGNYISSGTVATVSTGVGLSDGSSRSLQTLRFFPSDGKKHCYTVGPVNVSTRYLMRASFLYESYDGADTFPSFEISLDTSPWATVNIITASAVYVEEFVAVATGGSFVVCLYEGTNGNPFISSLELRPLGAGMYSVPYLDQSFLRKTLRVNFGALSAEAVRFPDDQSDRIWASDLASHLEGEAPGTRRISTNRSVDVSTTDRPPMSVMQTAVEGGKSGVSYRLNLEGYPAACYAVIYFAEIQELRPNQTRAFFFRANIQDTTFDGAVLNLDRDAGSFKAYEPGYINITFPAIVTIQLLEDNSSTLPPLINALEIYRIMPILAGTFADDSEAPPFCRSVDSPSAASPAEVPGDPCLPQPWDFLTCSSESPPRVSSIKLSSRNLTGSIPIDIGRMTGLVDLWLDNNQLTGTIPDLSQLGKLQTLHLQNNHLSGDFPSSLANIKSLTEIFVENNDLSGSIPASLLQSGVLIRADGNVDLCTSLSCAQSRKKKGNDFSLAGLIGGIVGGVVALVGALLAFYLWRKMKKKKTKKPREPSRLPFHGELSFTSAEFLPGDGNPLQHGDGARVFRLEELVEATENFSKKIGSGGFGPVYYGILAEGEEIAVKVMSSNSTQGGKEFYNEVTLLSRVHHRNLVVLLGYCLDLKERMLVYEYMHRGSLRDHLYGPLSEDEPFDWTTRLSVLLDSAKGLEYLHTGCSPTIIHRDVKSSNILINEKLTAKVSDFGLSRLRTDEESWISTGVRGTLGYLDPEYYGSQQLTSKSDVFSFGVVMLEVACGREPILVSLRGDPDANIIHWARKLFQNGDMEGLVDHRLKSNYSMSAMGRLVELAISCVDQFGRNRPTMSEIVGGITEIMQMESSSEFASRGLTDSMPSSSSRSSEVESPARRSDNESPSGSYNYEISSSDGIPPSGLLSQSTVDVPPVK